MMRAPLKTEELRAMALKRSSRSTRSAKKAWRAGMSNALPSPNSEAQKDNVPVLNQPRIGQSGQDGGQNQKPTLGPDQQTPTRETVDDDAHEER